MKAKKLLAMILSLTMLLGLCVVGTKADYEEDTVAVIGETEYSSVETAIKAARDGDVVQIVQAGTYSFNYNNMILYYSITIEGIEDQPDAVVLKNGSDAWKGITVYGRTEGSHPEVTIKNLVLDGNKSEKPQILTPIVCQYGDLTLENVTLQNAVRAVEVSAAETLSPSGGYVDGLTSTVTLKNVKTEGISGNTVKVEALPATDRSTEVTTTAVVCYDEACVFEGGMTALVRSGVNGVEGNKNHIVNKLDAKGNVLESTDLLPGNVTENDFISPAAYEDDIRGEGTRTYLPPVVQAGLKFFTTVQKAIDGAENHVAVTALEDDGETDSLTVTDKTITLDLAEDKSTNALIIDASSDVTILSGSYGALTVAEDSTLRVFGGTFTTDPNKYAAEGYVASNIDGKYVVGPKVVVDSAEDTTSATDVASGVTVTFETEQNTKLSTEATGMAANTSLALVVEPKATTGYTIIEDGAVVEDVIDISVKKTTVTTSGTETTTTTEDVPLSEITATVSYYFPNYDPNKVYKVYYFPGGSNAPVDMKATYNRNTQCFEFTINHNSEYGVVSTEIDTGNKTGSIDVVFLPTAELNVYDIAVKATDEDKYINGFRSADLTFELDVAEGTVTYVIAPMSGVTALNDTEAASGRYEFHMDGIHYDRANGNVVKLGTVTFLGYGKLDFTVKTADTNIVNTTSLDNSIVEHYTPSGALGLTIANNGAGTTTADPTALIGDLVLSPASNALTVNVMFPNNAADNLQAYQAMTMTVSGGDLYEDIVINLGSDPSFTGKDYLNNDLAPDAVTVAYNNGGVYASGTCNRYVVSIPALLHSGIRYTVSIEGAGYRTMRYSLNMNGDKSVTFWNNVMDADTVIERNLLPASDVAASAVKVTYLAGDIVQDAQINIYDLSAVVSYFGTTAPDIDVTEVSPYAKYDLNRDGTIDSIDVAYVLVSWGK